MTSTEKVIPKKRGRPATGKDPLVAFRAPAALSARIDAYAELIDKPRSAAIRRLVEAGLTIPPPPRKIGKTAPFRAGDRIKHKTFGSGTVVGNPIAMVGADPDSPSGVRDTGWKVTVEWDDQGRGTAGVLDRALTLE
jgi:hypothetical protein